MPAETTPSRLPDQAGAVEESEVEQPKGATTDSANAVDPVAVAAASTPLKHPEVPGDKTVVRVVMSPFHLDRKKRSLTPAAFRPRPGRDDVSVVQQDHDGDTYCKMRGKEIAKSHYKGLAAGLVKNAVAAGAKAVLDTPEGNFPGHADIITPFPQPKDEPLPAEQLKALEDCCEALVSAFTFYIDPDKAADAWTGPPLAQAS